MPLIFDAETLIAIYDLERGWSPYRAAAHVANLAGQQSWGEGDLAHDTATAAWEEMRK